MRLGDNSDLTGKKLLRFGDVPVYVLMRERRIAPKSRVAPIAVVKSTIPGPPSGTLSLRFAASIDELVVVALCAWARAGRINVAAARAQTLLR
jgi:hypothetical protein